MYKREYKKEGGYLEPEMRRNQKNRGGSKKTEEEPKKHINECSGNAWEGFPPRNLRAGLSHAQEQDWPRGRGSEPRSELPKGCASVKEHKKKLLMAGIGDKEACLSLTGVWGMWKKQMKNSKQSLGFPQIKIPRSL